MALFISAVAIVFLATGICALVEAALYAVRRPYILRLIEAKHPAGVRLEQFKEKMDVPITAILIFDTLLGVGGASIAGSQARVLYGENFVYWFTIGLAILLLVFAQIVPKVMGVVYNQSVARYSALPISLVIWLLYPAVQAISVFTCWLRPDEKPKEAIEDDVKQMARISEAEGSILGIEAELIQNSLRLNDVQASQIMTPRGRVLALPAEMTVRNASSRFKTDSYSRIPVFIRQPPGVDESSSPWCGMVLSRDILFALANDRFELQLEDLMRPLHWVNSDTPGHQLLDLFLKKRSHLFAVRNAAGEPIGIVTLKDVVEEILGDEIIDEKKIEQRKQ